MTSNDIKVEAQKRWQLSPAYTLIGFSVRHLKILTVKGQFKSTYGTLFYNETDPALSQVEAEIDVSSLNTGIAIRDHSVKAAQFLDAKQYTKITFKSTRVELSSNERGAVIGNLTIHGITREVALDTKLTGFGKNSSGKETISFEARTSINRKDFGLHWNALIETCGFLVGDTVNIEISVEGTPL